MSRAAKLRPWVMLHRVESGTFAQLPLFARALGAEILKLTDDRGRIQLGQRTPADAIAFALGADQGDRRLLRKFLPMLFRDGYLEHKGDTLIVTSFARWQAPPKAKSDDATSERADNEPVTSERAEHESDASRSRVSNESDATSERANNEIEAKSPKSHDPDHTYIEREKEIETERELGRVGARETFISSMPSKLHGTYLKQREKSGLRVALPRTGPEASAWAPEWERLASALWDQAEASGEPWEVVAKRVYQRFFVDGFAREQGFKAKMLLSNFAKYANPESRVAS